jgi:sugar/nucleoside kinase (ribokinase family)
MKNKVLSIGDLMLDVSVSVPGKRVDGLEIRSHIKSQGGGAAANVATWLSHYSTPTYLVSRVGDDSTGDVLLAELDRYGVEHTVSRVTGKSSGMVVVIIDSLGERTMYPDSGANSGLSPSDLPELDEFTFAYISGYCLANVDSRAGVLEIINRLRERKIPIIFDPSTVGIMSEVGVTTLQSWLPLFDFLILNEEEAQFLTGESNSIHGLALLLQTVPGVVIKRGSYGAIGQLRDSTVVNIPALPADLVDTTGAGDAFMAGFISAWLETHSLESAMKRGAEFGARCVEHIGSRPTA